MIDGRKVAACREDAGLTQFELAVECQRIVDVHRLSPRHAVSLSTIQRVEADRQDISTAKASTLAKALSVDVVTILSPLGATA